MAEDSIIFQEDGAPSHMAKSTRDYLKETVPKMGFLTDLAPHDFSLWAQLVGEMPARLESKVEVVAAVFNAHEKWAAALNNANMY